MITEQQTVPLQTGSSKILSIIQKTKKLTRNFEDSASAINQAKQDRRHIEKEFQLNRRAAKYESDKKLGNIIADASSSGIALSSFDDIFTDNVASHNAQQAQLRLNAEDAIRTLTRQLRQKRRNQQFDLVDNLTDFV